MWFDNGVMSIDLAGRGANLSVDHARGRGRRAGPPAHARRRAGPGHAVAGLVDRRRHGSRLTDAPRRGRAAQWPAPMADPLDLLTARLRPAFDAVAGGPGTDPVVRPSDRADAQANGALPLAKALGRNPREVAQAVVAAADLDGVADGRDRRARLPQPDARPGVHRRPRRRRRRRRRARHRAGRRSRRRVVVDYSAPNVAKEMHIGHLRTTAIGDALVRLLDAVGHDVVRENHIGDWGRPFGMLIEHLVDVGPERADTLGARRPRRVLQGRQPQVRRRTATSRTGARRRVVLLQQRRARDDRAVGASSSPRAPVHWNDVYGKLGVLLTDDDIAGESRYEALMPEVIERLRRRRAARRSPTAPRSCSRPGSRTARASRCR